MTGRFSDVETEGVDKTRVFFARPSGNNHSNNNLIIIHRVLDLGFVCYLIKSAPCRESTRVTPCQLRDSGSRFLVGCRSPSCLAAEKQDVLRPFSAD